MPSASPRRLALLGVLAALLSGCPFPIPPVGPFDPMFPGVGDSSVVIENTTDEDWIVTVLADVPWAFAVPAGQSGRAMLYGGTPTRFVLADRECTEVDTIEADAGDVTAVRIEGHGTLAPAPTPSQEDADELPILVEVFECGMGGAAPRAGAPIVGADGTLQLIGDDMGAWLLDPSSGSLTALTVDPDFDLMGDYSWSPDGRRVAFSRFAADGDQAVHVLDVETGESRVVAEGGTSPAWSPDGRRLAYLSLDPFAGGSALMIVDAAGGEPAELAEGASTPAWSPDGSRIAYVTYAESSLDPFAGGVEELRVVDVDSGASTTVGEASAFGPPPRWSPDGAFIAYAGGELEEGDVRIVAADGGEPRILDGPAGAMLAEPAWSPDGDRLAVTWTSTSFFAAGGGLGIVDLASGELTTLVEDESGFYATPIWSPDGAFVAVIRMGDAAAGEAMVVNVNDGTAIAVASAVMAIAGWAP